MNGKKQTKSLQTREIDLKSLGFHTALSADILEKNYYKKYNITPGAFFGFPSKYLFMISPIFKSGVSLKIRPGNQPDFFS